MFKKMIVLIKESGYDPKTSIENLANMIFKYFDLYGLDSGEYTDNPEGWHAFVMDSGGFAAFDFSK